MRVVDVFYAIPQLLLAILIMGVLGRGLENLFLAIILTSWLTLARQTRAQMLSLREKEFVKASRLAVRAAYASSCATCCQTHSRRSSSR